MTANNDSENPEKIYTDGGNYFRAMISDIGNAQSSINLETYIFKHDELGSRVAKALHAAATRGVKIRIVVDGAGSPSWGGSFARKLEKTGIESKVFHPFPWRFWQWSRSIARLPLLVRIIYLFLNANRRNHRKICMIDNSIVYVGSFNIDKCHLSHSDGGDNWRDMGIRLINTKVDILKHSFDALWHQHDIQERIREIFKQVNKNPTFRLNNSWYRRRILYKNLLKRISRCRGRIWITNSYFVPDSRLLRKLRDAAECGVDVRILLPRKSDVFIMPLAASAFYRSLLSAGVKIYEYLPNILHAKCLLIDDWVILGSSNLNHRSLLHDLEVDVNVKSEQSKQLLEQEFLSDLEQSQQITLENWTPKPIFQRVIGRLSLYCKYFI